MQDAIRSPRHPGTSRRARRLARRARAFAPVLAVPAIFALLALTMNRIEYGPARPPGVQPEAGSIGADAATPRPTQTAGKPIQTRTGMPEALRTLEPVADALSSASVIEGGWGAGVTVGADRPSSGTDRTGAARRAPDPLGLPHGDPSVPSAERNAPR